MADPTLKQFLALAKRVAKLEQLPAWVRGVEGITEALDSRIDQLERKAEHLDLEVSAIRTDCPHCQPAPEPVVYDDCPTPMECEDGGCDGYCQPKAEECEHGVPYQYPCEICDRPEANSGASSPSLSPGQPEPESQKSGTLLPTQEPDAMSDLSERELWLMRQAFLAGDAYIVFEEWLDEGAADAVTTKMVLEKDAPPRELPWTYYADRPIPSGTEVIVECHDGGKERWKAIAYEHEGHIIESGGNPIPNFYIVRWKPIL